MAGRQRNLGTWAHHLLDYLRRMHADNPSFFYALHNDHPASSIFWANPNARINYSYFGDTVTFHTPYRSNSPSPHRLPFAYFTGLNHHGHPVLFGCALLLNDSESSFVWLFHTWLQAMSGRHPLSLTTDPDRLIQLAVAQVLPQTRHRFCKWVVFKETQDKLASVYQSHPTFESEFHKCINETETIDEFETSWQSLLGKYYLVDNEWLQSMYNVRQQWVPVYMRDTFFGELSSAEATGGPNSYFDGFVTATTTIQMLTKQYEKAMASWHEKELKADSETTNSMPLLKTPSPMEKQAADLYTRRIFVTFQEELVETLANPATKIDESGTVTTYRVAKFGEDHRAQTVSFNSFETKASCSCQMFEHSGIICRHILAVFRAKNVLTLPSPYVLKRWTRNAKIGAVLEEHPSEAQNGSRESLTVRYNNLRQEAIKFVEEGAKSMHTYNVAMNALQEAAEKVAAMRNRDSGALPNDTLPNGVSQELPAATLNHTACQSADEKAKKIRELTAELESTNRRCQVYRENLLAVLRDMEEQKLNLSVKVQNARISLKE